VGARATAAGAAPEGGRGVALLRRAVDVRPDEVGAVARAFVYFFALVSSFYVLRPIREEMGIRGGVDRLHWVFTATFAVMLAAIPAYSALVARVPRARAVPLVYRFFAANLLAFFLLFRAEVQPAWTARAFFVWLSVYNLFVVSVFWSLMADLFTSAQGKRLFGFVAGGGSAGALAGSALAGGLVGAIGIANLLLVAVVLLELAVRCARGLAGAAPGRGASPGGGAEGSGAGAPLGGSVLSGITTVFRSRYLAAVSALMLLYTLASTFLYFQQARIVAAAIAEPERRTALFAGVDLAVNVGALVLQTLATGRLAVAFGLGPGLGAVPVLTGLGFAALAVFPGLWVLAAVQAVRRSAEYALQRPARDVLFTVVSRDEKYKAKGFIDTVVYRGGDALAAWIHAGLAGLGLSMPALAVAGLPAAAASLAVAVYLVRRHRALEQRPA
jgi:AAA family ATP:ADP antiporter